MLKVLLDIAFEPDIISTLEGLIPYLLIALLVTGAAAAAIIILAVRKNKKK